MELFQPSGNRLKFHPEEFEFSSDLQVCGIDEAGRGPLAGPLSLSLVQFSKESISKILHGDILVDLNDSKKLSEKKRNVLYSEIFQHAEIVVHQFISNKFIDKFGISYSIFTAIQKLIKKSKFSNPFLLIDGNYNFQAHQLNTGFNFQYKSIVKGDSKVASIAAASIIAKVKRDRFMISIATRYPQYCFSEHKGYGTANHISKIKEFGYSPLHRLTFKIRKGAHGT